MIRKFLMPALAITCVATAYAAATLDPRDAGPLDTWKSVYWCGVQRDVFRVGDEYWAVYEAVSLKNALPTKEHCEKQAAAADADYVGLFILRWRPPFPQLGPEFYKPKTGCPAGELYFNQIAGFVNHLGKDTPVLGGPPLFRRDCSK